MKWRDLLVCIIGLAAIAAFMYCALNYAAMTAW